MDRASINRTAITCLPPAGWLTEQITAEKTFLGVRCRVLRSGPIGEERKLEGRSAACCAWGVLETIPEAEPKGTEGSKREAVAVR